jgi:hypothetical protein
MGVRGGVHAAGETLEPGSAESGQFLNLTEEELSGLSDAMDLAESVMDRKTEELETAEEEELLVPGESTDDAPDYTRVDEVLGFFVRKMRVKRRAARSLGSHGLGSHIARALSIYHGASATLLCALLSAQ